MSWVQAVKQAREELGITGFVAVKKGTPLYNRSKEIHTQMKEVQALSGGGNKKKGNKKSKKSKKKKGANPFHAWKNAVTQARAQLGITGFVLLKKGTPLYNRAMKIKNSM